MYNATTGTSQNQKCVAAGHKIEVSQELNVFIPYQATKAPPLIIMSRITQKEIMELGLEDSVNPLTTSKKKTKSNGTKNKKKGMKLKVPVESLSEGTTTLSSMSSMMVAHYKNDKHFLKVLKKQLEKVDKECESLLQGEVRTWFRKVMSDDGVRSVMSKLLLDIKKKEAALENDNGNLVIHDELSKDLADLKSKKRAIIICRSVWNHEAYMKEAQSSSGLKFWHTKLPTITGKELLSNNLPASAYRAFVRVMAIQMVEDNLIFMKSVRDMNAFDDEDYVVGFVILYNTSIKTGSAKEVNISSSLRDSFPQLYDHATMHYGLKHSEKKKSGGNKRNGTKKH